MQVRLGWLLGLMLSCGVVVAQDASRWTVKPEWVRGHEAFLASDALNGRGSATRDEWITASYVASEFEGYGLKTAPGMDGYLQTAGVMSVVLDGQASLVAGPVRLKEGSGMTLLMNSGASVSGPLVRVRAADVKTASAPKGSVVVLTDVPADATAMSLGYALLRLEPAAVLLREDVSTRDRFTEMGGRTRVPVWLEGKPQPKARATFATLDVADMETFGKIAPGTTVTVQVRAVPQAKPRSTYNAIGYLQGTDAAAGTLLLTAHLDHLGVGRPVNGDVIWNGANDDASGTTAVLELAHALAAGPRPRRSVLFVCYGSEELGELGSTYFGEHPPVPLKELVANLEFEMIGSQDPKMPKGTLLLTGWDRSNLGPELKAHGALLGPDVYPEQHFFERSDNYALALQGVVAHTAAGWGTPPEYHHPDDDLQHLDLLLMTAAIQSLVEPVRWLANSEFRPEWKAGGRPR